MIGVMFPLGVDIYMVDMETGQTVLEWAFTDSNEAPRIPPQGTIIHLPEIPEKAYRVKDVAEEWMEFRKDHFPNGAPKKGIIYTIYLLETQESKDSDRS